MPPRCSTSLPKSVYSHSRIFQGRGSKRPDRGSDRDICARNWCRCVSRVGAPMAIHQTNVGRDLWKMALYIGVRWRWINPLGPSPDTSVDVYWRIQLLIARPAYRNHVISSPLGTCINFGAMTLSTRRQHVNALTVGPLRVLQAVPCRRPLYWMHN